MDNATAEDDVYLDREGLRDEFPYLPHSANHLRRLEAKGFPAGIKVSERVKVWRRSEILAYVKQKEQEARERAKRAVADLPKHSPHRNAGR